MCKVFTKIFSLFSCIGSLIFVLVSLWAYFIVKGIAFNLFIMITLFFGFIFIFELYNLFKDNNDLKSFLLTNKINFSFFLDNLGSLILAVLSLYLGIANVEDVSKFDRKLFLFGGLFFLILPLSSFWFKLKGIKKYYALPKEGRDEVEKRISHLSKIGPVFVLIGTIIAFILYLLTRR